MMQFLKIFNSKKSSGFTKLKKNQIRKKINFINKYERATTAAEGSDLDSNANVTQKTAVTLGSELNKDANIQVNREIIRRKIQKMFGRKLAKQYIKDIESHLIYVHDETSLLPYCVSVSMYPFLLKGMQAFDNGDESSSTASDAPHHLRSFCGSYISLVQYLSSNFAGAVATIEFLMYFDYFARKDFGDDYLKTHLDTVSQELQGVVYLLNQDSSARGGQSAFTNISTFDKYFFEGVFGDFVFPDMTKPDWESIKGLQNYWHQWFRDERTKKLLTFPVVTHCAIANDNKTDWKDLESAEFVAEEMSLGGEFFIYTSDTADSLASCCRLKNEITDNTFSYSLGAGGLSTGSKNVITINVNRMVQKKVRLEAIVDRIQKYQLAFNEHFSEWVENGMLPVYKSGMITLDDQYSTIGVNGVVESAEFLGMSPTDNQVYKDYLISILGKIKAMNKIAKEKYGCKFNTEFVPAENLGVKNANWDKKDGLFVPRDCYNSYMYVVEDETPIIDKLRLHGGEVLKNLDGGSAVHWNSEERKTKDQYRQFLKSIIITGSNYVCENVKKTCCNSCGRITANTLDHCPYCGSKNVDYATRVIGFLKKIKNFSIERIKEEARRAYEKAQKQKEKVEKAKAKKTK